MTIKMTENIDDLIKRLRAYNEWRRGGNGEQPDPAEIGRDIDEVIELLEDLAGINAGGLT